MKKRTYTYALAALLTATMPSCVDLEEHPESNLTTNQFYNNAGDANAAVSAIYSGLNPSGQSLFRTLLQIGMEMATDDYEAGPRARNAHVRAISNVVYDAGNNRFQEMWRVSYDNINRANIAIDKIAEIPSAEISDELRAQYINEAKFLRAIYYFNLVRWFREVPLVLHETTSLDPASIYVVQATEDEVYEQIIQDLTDAEQLPTSYGSVDVGRATSGAASSLLSKVYLTRGQWALAESKSLEVIRSSRYSLFENYADVWSLDHENGQEHIFVIPFKGNANFVGNDLALRAATTEVPGINGEYTDALHREGGLWESFRATDKRVPVTFVTEMDSPADGKHYVLTNPNFNKYYDETVVGNQSQSSKDIHYIRYAEVLLIYAEAASQAHGGPTTEAYDAIDQVRQRAGIPLLKDIAPTLSQEQFRDSVYEERRHEFVYEYQRWFDLVRRGSDYYVAKLHAAGKTSAEAKHIHFPIPQRELDLNPKLHQLSEWK